MLERKDLASDDAMMTPIVLRKEFELLLQTIMKIKGVVEGAAISLSKSGTATQDVVKSVEQLTDSEKEVIKIQNQLSTALAKSNEEYIEYKRLVNDVNKATNDKIKYGNVDAKNVTAQNSSITQLGLALQKNRQEYANLRTEQDRNSKSGKELLSVIQKQDDSYKKLNASTGKHQDNVGKYPQLLQQVAPGFSSMATSIWGVVKASAALILTPLGITLAALALVLSPIVSYFTSTAEGMDRAEVATARWNARLSVLKDLFNQAGKFMAEFILGVDEGTSSIEKNAKSDALWVAVLTAIHPSLTAVAIAMNERAKVAGELAAIMDELNEAEEKYSVTEKELLNEQTKLRIEAKALNLTTDEKIAKLEEAANIEKQIAYDRGVFANQELEATANNAKAQLSILSLTSEQKEALQKSDFESYRDYAKRLIDIARIKDDAIAKSLIDSLNKQSDAEDGQLKIREKIANELIKLEEQKAKELAELAIQQHIQTVQALKFEEDSQKTSISTQRDYIAEKLDNLKQHGIDVSDVQKVVADRLLTQSQEEYAKQLEEEEKAQAALLKLKQQAWQTAHDVLTNFFDKELIMLDARKNRLETMQAAELTAAGNNANAKAAIESRYAAQLKANENEMRAVRRKKAIAEKTLAAFQIGIQTTRAAIEVLPNYILSAIIAATGALALVSVLTKPIPQFKDGGITKTPIIQAGEEGIERFTTPQGVVGFTPGEATKMMLPIGTKIDDHKTTVRELALTSLGSELSIDRENRLLYDQLAASEKTQKQVGRQLEKAILKSATNLSREGSILYNHVDKGNGNRTKIRLKSMTSCLLLTSFLLFSCSKMEDIKVSPVGCSTGIIKGQRKLIRCCYEKEHDAGNNVKAGGIITFTLYSDWKWEPSNCETCRQKYQ